MELISKVRYGLKWNVTSSMKSVLVRNLTNSVKRFGNRDRNLTLLRRLRIETQWRSCVAGSEGG